MFLMPLNCVHLKIVKKVNFTLCVFTTILKKLLLFKKKRVDMIVIENVENKKEINYPTSWTIFSNLLYLFPIFYAYICS